MTAPLSVFLIIGALLALNLLFDYCGLIEPFGGLFQCFAILLSGLCFSFDGSAFLRAFFVGSLR